MRRSFQYDFLAFEALTDSEQKVFALATPLLKLVRDEAKRVHEVLVSQTMRIDAHDDHEAVRARRPVCTERDRDGAFLRTGRERRPLLSPPRRGRPGLRRQQRDPRTRRRLRRRVFASIFTSYGGYRSGHTFVAGMTPAVYAGAAIVAAGSLLAFAIGKRSAKPATLGKREPQAAIASMDAAA